MNTTIYDVIKVLFNYLSYSTIVRLRKTNKIFHKVLEEAEEASRNKIPWKIITEYHYRRSKIVIHQSKVIIGFQINEEICDYCCGRNWNRVFNYDKDDSVVVSVIDSKSVLTSDDIKVNIVSGVGGLALSKLIKNKTYVPIWYKLDYSRKTASPLTISYEDGNNLPKKTTLYYDEAVIILGDLNNVNKKKDLVTNDNLYKKKSESYNYLEEGQVVTYKGVNHNHLLDISLDWDNERNNERDFKRMKY